MRVLAKPENIICILGMHRSGTSALTGSLQQYGLELGKHHTWNRHNQKGNRENQDLVDLHDSILATNGGSWDNPPKKVDWSSEHVERACDILASYSDVQHWGFKDPRTLIVLPFWRELCSNLRYVGIFRHPVAVAKSLNKRDNMPMETAYQLWYEYNSRLLRAHKRQDFPMVSFDASPAQLEQAVELLARALGLNPASQPSPFYSQDLHHHRQDRRERLPIKVSMLYRKLLRLSRATLPTGDGQRST